MLFVVTSVLIVLLDQFSKRIVEQKINLGEKIEIIKNKFYILRLKNKGAAYGLLAKHQKILALLTTFSCLDILLAFRKIFKNGEGDAYYKFSLACIVGGAFGNIIDRFRNKAVTDFIYIPFSKNAPVFNLADVAIFVGAVVLFIRHTFSGYFKRN